MSTQKDSRGSEWRKWDLHLHCPGTKLADAFTLKEGNAWDTYCTTLHASDVHAFGITDYFSVDAYESCLKEYRSRYKSCPKIFFPNIELRTGDVVNRAGEEVNIHLIFNPAVPDCIERIRRVLRLLKTNKTVAGSVAVTADELNTENDFQEATTTREHIGKALHDVYGTDSDLSEFVLIVAAANNDGIRPPRGVRRKELITDEIDKLCDGFFGNADSAKHFLKTYRLEDKALSIDAKPVFTGCDAHSFAELDTYLGKVVVNEDDGKKREPTWVKADLSFEGLKQTLFEPGERVFIGAEPEIEDRVRKNETRYIQALHVTCKTGYANSSGTWFKDEHISLSKELVAIIGNKGSGKSALADIIGLLGNSHNQIGKGPRGTPERLFSFLSEQKFLKPGYASNFVGELQWYAGAADKKQLDATVDQGLPEKVEYLPQKYLERICANVEYSEFETTLNEVIFGYVRADERHGRQSFDDLIAYLSQQADENIRAAQVVLHTANETVVGIERKLTPNYKKELDEKVRLKREELASHSAQPPSEKPKPANVAANPSADTSPLAALESEILQVGGQINALLSERRTKGDDVEQLNQAKQAIDREQRSIAAVRTAHKDALLRVGLEFDEIMKVVVDTAKLDKTITDLSSRLADIDGLLADEDEIEQHASDTEKQAARDVSLTCKNAALSKRKSDLIDQLGKPEREYQAYLQELALWDQRGRKILGTEVNPAPGTLRDLMLESRRIADTYPGELVNARAARDQASLKVFEEKRGLTKFYDSVKKAIDGEIGKHGDDLGDYAISIQAGLSFEPRFYDEFLAFVAQNAKGTFYGKDDGKAALQQMAAKVSDWQSDQQILAFVQDVVEALHTDRRTDLKDGDRARSVADQLRDRKIPAQLYNYLFGFDYLRPKYELKVDGKDLSELSPGERGGLLLVFYLMLDRRDIPLVVDQPEDNLDNKSVYEILVKFLKKAKKRRQIIIVTHNPNLAVVADAEQIIHVSIDKKVNNDFDFVSGSIENPVTNALALDILEGTRPAFDNRRLKYRTSSAISRPERAKPGSSKKA